MARILIIDDYAQIRQLYSEILTKNGYAVDTVDNADQGLLKILVGGYHLILLDLLMPQKNALWVLEQLQNQTPQQPNGKIIIMSFEDKNEDIENLLKQTLSKGASGVLDKKISLENDFLVKIQEFLQEKI